MTPALAHMSRRILIAGLAVLALAQADASRALPLDHKDIAADRAEHKRAAAEGKLPLPGTPDLDHLDERIARKGLPEDSAMLIRIFKAESELEIWMSRGGGAVQYTLFAAYPICYWSGTLGPKLKEGDRQAPEGFYTVTWPQTHPNGQRHPLALNIGYPNTFDLLHARSGSSILIHGGCASIGCFAMTNGVYKEIRTLAARALNAGQAYIPVHVFPFRMTEANLARYETPELHDFWRNLKEGYDLFERTHRPPRISVCGARYDFEEGDVVEADNPGPISVCPRTALLIQEMERINTRVAEQDGPLPAPAKTAFAYLPSYLGAPRQAKLTQRGKNSLEQLAPEILPVGVSPILTRPLACSLALPSCRKYQALRERLVHAAIAKAAADDEPKPHKKVVRHAHKRRHR
jgi:murein L,D-transpeptidase YafK